MHLNPQVLRAVAIMFVLFLLYGSRLMKGKVKETPEGPAFGIKPFYAWARAIALPGYILFFAYIMIMRHQALPWWMLLLFLAAICIGVLQMPGTIVLTPLSIKQRFWLQPSKEIQYTEVMAIQAMQGGRMTQVIGDNRVKITHTSNHSAAMEFQQEIEQRTGKRLIR